MKFIIVIRGVEEVMYEAIRKDIVEQCKEANYPVPIFAYLPSYTQEAIEIVWVDKEIEMENIYVPKRSCPRDLEFFYCDECIEEALEISVATDYPEKPRGCGKIVDGKSCGYSHLGYEWCKECKEANRREHSHIGEFEIVATVKE